MKLSFVIGVLLPATGAAVPAIHSWRRNLRATLASRNLQSCEGVGLVVTSVLQEHYADNLGDASAMTCETYSVAELGCRVACTTIPHCCGDICGSLEQTLYYDQELEELGRIVVVEHARFDRIGTMLEEENEIVPAGVVVWEDSSSSWRDLF